jgi:enamidase
MKKFLTYLIVIGVISTITFMVAYQHNLYVWQKPQQNMWIYNGNLFDATGLKPTKNTGILIVDGKISCLGPDCQIPQDTLQIDASGKAIVPGLIELHGHFFGGRAEQGRPSVPAMIWDSIRFNPTVRQKLIDAGITSYRSVGDPSSGIFDLKKQLDNQEIAGPRMFVAGPIFTIKNGHPTQGKIPTWMIEQMTVQSNESEFVKKKISELVKQGIDGIKVVYQSHTNKQGVVTMPRISKETLNTITSEARKHGLWVAVHTGSPEETIDVIEAGITTIEHGVRNGNLIQPETIKLIANNNVTYVPTLGREPKGHLNVPSLYQAGVKFGVGTDTQGSMIVGNSYHNELTRMVDAGLPDVEVLLAATRNGAIALGKIDNIGTIEVGKYADLLLVSGQPWHNISDLKKVELVVLSGRIALDKLAK